MKQWIEHFRRRKPKDVMRVLVDPNSDVTLSRNPDVTNENCYVVKTDNIANFQYWWPRMIRFLFLSVKSSANPLTYTLKSVNMHEEDNLQKRLVQSLNSFVRAERTHSSKQVQTVKLIGGNGDCKRNREVALHIVLATCDIDRSEFTSRDSVHTRAEVLRCVLFILIDAGIVPVRRTTIRLTTLKLPRVFMCLLSILVFILNLPAAMFVLSYIFTPLLGCIAFLYFTNDKMDLRVIVAFDVMALAPFIIVGSLSLTEHIILPLSNIWTIVLFFLLPLIYIVGWMTIFHIYCYKKLNCKYGIRSLSGSLWSFEPHIAFDVIIFVFGVPVMIVQAAFMTAFAISNSIPLIVFFEEATLKTKIDLIFDTHILAVEPIPFALMMLLAYPWYYAVPVCFALSCVFITLSFIDSV